MISAWKKNKEIDLVVGWKRRLTLWSIANDLKTNVNNESALTAIFRHGSKISVSPQCATHTPQNIPFIIMPESSNAKHAEVTPAAIWISTTNFDKWIVITSANKTICNHGFSKYSDGIKKVREECWQDLLSSKVEKAVSFILGENKSTMDMLEHVQL